MTRTCIFCRIVAGDAPAFVVAEDARTTAFLDRGQATVGHTLVVPRNHAADVWAISAEDAGAVIAMAKEVDPHPVEPRCRRPRGLPLPPARRPALA